jgi:hypothetical protein
VSGFLEPVEVVLERHHAYKSKGPRTRGCAICGEAKTHPGHLGAPPSLSVMDTNGHYVYSAFKAAWQQLLAERIEASGLARGLAHVLAEGECTFPDRHRRDQGNHRFMVEKALGDALVHGSPPSVRERAPAEAVTGGWLRDDSWDQYEFAGLAARYEKGVSRTRLLLFATVGVEAVAA